MPVGFKNSTDGSTQIAVDAVLTARSPHWFPSVTKQGVSAIFQTVGNDACHVDPARRHAHRPELRRRARREGRRAGWPPRGCGRA